MFFEIKVTQSITGPIESFKRIIQIETRTERIFKTFKGFNRSF